MESGPMLIAVIGLAIALAIFAGGWAARVLLHAASAEPRKAAPEAPHPRNP